MNCEIPAETFDDQSEKSLSGALWAPIATIIALYFFGIGPAVSRPIQPSVQHVFERLYEPVFFVAQNVPPVGAALQWYMRLWGYDIWYGFK